MSENHEKPTSIEQALAELEQATRAGAFRPTPLDIKALLNGASEAETPWIIRYRKTVAAAAVVFATGVWGAMFAMQIGDVQRVKLASSNQPAGVYAAVAFQNCVAGPKGSLTAACKTFDVDTDGDVDLADISSIQLAYSR